MKVECPNCHTTYNLPDDKVGPAGATVRCSLCKHVFHVDETPTDDFPGFGESASDGWPVDVQDRSGQERSAEDDFAAALDSERMKDPYDDVGVSSSEFASIDFGKPEKKKGAGLTRKGIILAAALGLVALVGVAGAGAYFFEFWPFAMKPAPSAMENAETPGAPAKPAAPDYTSQIQITSHNNYFVDNEKTGKLFIIEGKLVNKSPVVVGQISLDAALLDAKDAPVVSKEFLAGPKASNFELRTLGKEDLESRLSSRQEIMLNNSAVKPGEEVPFMVAFIAIPDTVRNFTLKVKNYFEVAPPGQNQQPEAKK